MKEFRYAACVVLLGGCAGPRTPIAGAVPTIDSFAAAPAAIQSGQRATLSWSVSGATALTIDNGVGAVTGSSTTVAPSVTTTFVLSASNAAGSVQRTATVTVGAPQKPVISAFAATPVSIQAGRSATLSWTTTGATSLSIDQGVGEVSERTSVVVAPSVSTTYTLTANSAAGSVARTAAIAVTQATAPDATVSIDTSLQRRPISRYVYGYNASRAADAPPGATWLRIGGNRWTAWNWTNNYSNAGSDYIFHNDTYLGGPLDGPAHPAMAAIDDARANGLGVLLTIPIQGWASRDASGTVSTTAPQGDHFVQNLPAKGPPFNPAPPITSDPIFQDELAAALAARWGNAPLHLSLDNEPDLWSGTHAEVQRTPLSYAGFLAQSIASATAIKAAVPTALLFGPVSYGYAGFLNLQNAPDANGRDFLDFYLDQLKTASQTAGHRLLDVLDLHFYSEAYGCGDRVSAGGTSRNSDCVVAARVQSTRSLSDAAYKEDSWITRCCSGGTGINLLPRMQAKIAAHDAGVKLAITEYNHGGSDDVSGAVAQADTLGALGREGAYAAAYWPLLSDNTWAFAAWRAFRSYDGAGSNFGETSVQVASSDLVHVAAYASVTAAGRVVLVLVHRPGAITNSGGAVTGMDGKQARTVRLQVTHSSALGTARAWQLAPAAAPSWQALPAPVLSGNVLTLTLPALSVTTVELSP